MPVEQQLEYALFNPSKEWDILTGQVTKQISSLQTLQQQTLRRDANTHSVQLMTKPSMVGVALCAGLAANPKI